MTTLPSIPTRSHGHPSGHPEVSRAAAPGVTHVRIEWRVLRRATDASGLRGGGVRTSAVEAVLTDSTIVLRLREGDREISALVLPARGRSVETPGGTLVEWRVLQDGGSDSPALRLLSTDDAAPLVRCDLLDRVGVGGGRHEIVSIEIAPDDRPD
jgi:hypothetical protein